MHFQDRRVAVLMIGTVYVSVLRLIPTNGSCGSVYSQLVQIMGKQN